MNKKHTNENINDIRYIDIHTHSLSDDPKVKEVEIIDMELFSVFPKEPTGYFCAGIHPWSVDEIDEDSFIGKLSGLRRSLNFFALGEIGLDKVKNKGDKDNFEKQLRYFKIQLDFAVKYKIPRIVLHSVKAYSEILHELKEADYQGKVLLHDFNANIDIANQFIKFNGHFSFGKNLFKPESKASKVIGQLPQDRIFLETDDQANYNIFEIYLQASSILEIGEAELKVIIDHNFNNFLK